MEKLTSTDEASYWHSAPLAFAILPAFAGFSSRMEALS
jgi:hypothetical protein